MENTPTVYKPHPLYHVGIFYLVPLVFILLSIKSMLVFEKLGFLGGGGGGGGGSIFGGNLRLITTQAS